MLNSIGCQLVVDFRVTMHNFFEDSGDLSTANRPSLSDLHMV